MPRWLRGTLVALLLIVLFVAGTVAGIVAAYSRNLPDISRMADYQPASSTRIFARDGTQLASVYKENRVWVPLSRIPLVMQHAVIANEDHNFYTHHGVDFGGILRAAIADLTHQEFQGASTITQQLARKLFLNDQVSISRKIQEALLAMEIERYYTKDEILERYLNMVYLGAGAYGVDAAAHTYFGERVENLTLPQAAMLAGVIAAPSDYSPFANLQLAKDRQSHVLDRMVDSGFITHAQAVAARTASVGLTHERAVGLQGYLYPYYTTYVLAQLEKDFGKRAVEEGGLQVYTALDVNMQKIAQQAVDWGMNAASAEGINAHEAALVAIRPSTGEIVAMVGGRHFSLDNQFNRAWQAHRQPGSSFKAYVYTAAIDSGMPPNSIIEDTPIGYPMGDGTTWYPKDDDNSYMGAITLRTALAQSRNIAAVRLAEKIGIDKVIEYAHRMGVTSPLEANLSLALGSSVVTPLDQASGYSTLANQGVHIDPSAIRLVRDSLGNNILDNQYPQATEVVSAGTAYLMTSMLEDVIKHGTGYPNAIIGRPAAGKTGTTSDFRDAWFVGYTPDLVAAVWVGNDNYSRMNESYGGNIPARIWARFMKGALAKVAKHDFPFPQGEVVKVASCSGGYDYYLNGTQPISGCGSGYAAQAATVSTPLPATTALPSISPLPATLPPETPVPADSVQPADTAPPESSTGDGAKFQPLGESSTAPKAKPTATTQPPHRRR
ncbi:MAG TPA: PBP1A family penicillin-binding protein [Candidatus Aquilonibacter sp.]|nr:PBP1A family penicillin-binding protein [Candidatus Aquilonibacter sp.]